MLRSELWRETRPAVSEDAPAILVVANRGLELALPTFPDEQTPCRCAAREEQEPGSTCADVPSIEPSRRWSQLPQTSSIGALILDSWIHRPESIPVADLPSRGI